ncbi:unnamed protein product, partial [Arabidopsis halleri]
KFSPSFSPSSSWSRLFLQAFSFSKPKSINSTNGFSLILSPSSQDLKTFAVHHHHILKVRPSLTPHLEGSAVVHHNTFQRFGRRSPPTPPPFHIR